MGRCAPADRAEYDREKREKNAATVVRLRLKQREEFIGVGIGDGPVDAESICSTIEVGKRVVADKPNLLTWSA